MSEYAKGGYVPRLTPVVLGAHECLLAKRDEGFRCIRSHHRQSPADEVKAGQDYILRRYGKRDCE